MQAVDLSHITIDQALHPVLAEKNINLCVLRTDKIHPVISGNKWFKLRYYIEDALKNRKTTLVTKGGAWSNHIVATAAACKHYNLRSIGIIRGEAALIKPASIVPLPTVQSIWEYSALLQCSSMVDAPSAPGFPYPP